MDGQMAAATLGVARTADQDEIRRAFRAQAKRLHPDVGPCGSESAFVALREAFDHLMATGSEPAPLVRTMQRSPVRPWFEFHSATRRSTSVDMRDAQKRQHRASSGLGAPDGRRDARGRDFADHLASALARS